LFNFCQRTITFASAFFISLDFFIITRLPSEYAIMADAKLIMLPGAKNKQLWKYFGMRSKDGHTVDKDQSKKVYCRVQGCLKPELPYSGNTSVLATHLAKEHRKEHLEFLGKEAPGSPSTNSTIRGCFGIKPPMDLDSSKGREITSRIMGIMIKDLRPFSIVENTGFRDLISYFAPEYPMATRQFYANKISDKYSVAIGRMQEMLQAVSTVSITVDLWTSQAMHAYLGVTVHYVDDEWKLRLRVLDCVELPGDQHSAADIAPKLKERLEFWHLYDGQVSKVIAATSDNGQNMVNALRDERHLGIPTVLGCVAHTINLCVEKGMKVQRVSHVMARARGVVGLFNKSSKLTYQLRRAQVDGGKSESEVLMLVQDVATRWTAGYAMLQRLVKLYDDFVHIVLVKSGKAANRRLALSPQDVWQMRQLCEALEPLCLAMQGMGGEAYCSLSLVEPLLYKLLNKHLVISNNDTPIVFDFKAAALADLKSRFSEPAVKALLVQATFIDPRFKDFKFVKQTEVRDCKLQLARTELLQSAKLLRVSELSNTTSTDTMETGGKRKRTENDRNGQTCKRTKGNYISAIPYKRVMCVLS
jgi:hypothetical protein